MKNWFDCAIKYDTIDEQGAPKSVTEQILVNAVNYTEAETKITAVKSEEIKGEFMVTKITRTSVEDVVSFERKDIWFKGKVVIVDIDEKTGREKNLIKTIYVSENSFMEAANLVAQYLKNTWVQDSYINTLQHTKIVDILE